MTNRLVYESSPYLLQHAENPVDWFPWDQEALALARELNKPILLSVGYAACHWCHVMAHESFEDPETASLMNDYFINIKVDREERPDIDRIYMNAVVAMTGQGGWPMTVALTPEGEPFFGGTYFPPMPRHGLPSFKQVLSNLADAWKNRRDQVLDSALGIADHLGSTMAMETGGPNLDESVLEKAFSGIRRSFDERHGGFGQAPKFPQPMTLEYLLRYYLRNGDNESLNIVERTLEKMAKGGIFDQLGGGFARYSTDNTWLVPHFEKMLYDNALLARVYLHAWKVTGRPLFRRVVEETLDWLLAEMHDEGGGFYSSLDADSEGVEGKYYVWSAGEIRNVLEDDADLFMKLYGVTQGGNYEGANILHGPNNLSQIDVDLKDAVRLIALAKEKLAGARESRVRPGLDDKVLTSWNGLALAAFAEAGRELKSEVYLEAAIRNAEFIFENLRQPDGRLFRTWKAGNGAKIAGFLEDYAFLADGLLSLYQSTFDERWFAWGQELADHILSHFVDSEGVGFFDTPDDHEKLISRPRETQDNAIPSGNAVAVSVLLQLYLYVGNGLYWDTALEALSSMQSMMAQHPLGFGHWLGAASFALGELLEIAIVGDQSEDDTKELLEVVFSQYRPNIVTAVGREQGQVPLLQGRNRIDNVATAYVCRQFVCERPVTNAAELKAQIDPTNMEAA
ncbi:MAG: thioredoxin domain-containing protein [Candidatus Promineifilaceae bacterium]